MLSIVLLMLTSFFFYLKTIAPAGVLISGTQGTDCTANRVCFAITGSMLNAIGIKKSLKTSRQHLIFYFVGEVKLWGPRGALTMVTVTGASNAKAVIPLIQAGPNYGKLMYLLICLHSREER